jgi:deazaflavin-dependent oxidoreductase (nitroreductase family)
MAQRRRQLKRWERVLERVAGSRAGGWYFLNVANKIDKRLVPATNGRFSSAVGQQVLVIEVVGAKSGVVRRVPLVYLTDGPNLVLVASNAGSAKHPAWYHNLRKTPEATVFAKNRSGRYRASFPEGPEYDRLWDEARDYYAGYDVYKQRAGDRRIPLVLLTPAA